MEPRERKHGLFSMFSLWGLYLHSSTIRRCEPYVQFLSLLKSTRRPDSHRCILSYFIFLRIGERCLFCSRTSFSPQCRSFNFTCWTWYTNSYLWFFYHSVSCGAFGKFGGIICSHFRLQTDVGKACWIIGTVCMAVNAPLIVFSVSASWPPRVVILSKKSRSDMECKRFCLIENGDAHPTAWRTFERW